MDLAFKGFFRRCKTGDVPGCPRFKARRRFHTAHWDEPVSWAVDPGRRTLRIQGVGVICLPKGARRQFARLAARGGRPVSLRVTRCRAGTGWVWRAAVVFRDVRPDRQPPAAGAADVTGVDRGVTVTAALSDGRLLVMPRWARDAADLIADCRDRRRARGAAPASGSGSAPASPAPAGRSPGGSMTGRATPPDRSSTADRVIALERLRLASMTRSARGTVEEPGVNVAAKSGLNRSLLEGALGALGRRVCVRAEEAGRTTWLVDPARTSQTCTACGHVDPASRVGVAFRCTSCGHAAHADTNAATNIAALGRRCETAWHMAGEPPEQKQAA